jgi:hypothetical protein
MAANTIPIYTKQGQIDFGSVLLKTANTTKDGTTSANRALLFTAGADGARVERVRARAIGTNVATVLRIFINNGSDPDVAGNNILYAEKTLAATTGSEAAELLNNELPTTTDPTAFPLVLPPNYRLYATIGTTVASGWSVSAIGGTY